MMLMYFTCCAYCSSNSGCPNVQHMDFNDSFPAQFCGGRASVPRGVVYPPVNFTGHTLSCPNGSTVVDARDSPPTNCTSEEPRL